ncbi:hypothetical protein [Microcoleus sp. herbarium12]|uniref:hypothetical protein n=1 Tax=Microcoleus sp. herbarium12 TaxID=3055437 RepID=UPI002FD13AEF
MRSIAPKTLLTQVRALHSVYFGTGLLRAIDRMLKAPIGRRAIGPQVTRVAKQQPATG